jgi:DNA polymerase-4
VARSVLRAELPVIAERGLTLLGLSVGNLATTRHVPEQLLLPFGRKDPSRLDHTVDELRERFGHRALTRASLLGRTVGFEVPKLPD